MNFRWFIVVTVFIAVTAVAQEVRETNKPDAAQAQQETEQPQAEEEEVTADVPERIDPTEEVSEDYSIDFPVDI